MANLFQLFEQSHNNSDLLTFEATVDTGFEALAAKECISKFGPDTSVCYERGRIYVNVTISQYYLVKSLRSVNNLLLVAGVIRDIDLLPAEEQNVEKDLSIIGKLADGIGWKKYLEAWKHVSNFNGNLYPTREQYLEAVSKHHKSIPNTNNETPSEINEKDDNQVDDLLRYRVTCYRSGKHSFGSQDAARSLGGRLQDMFQWVVDLEKYKLEIVFYLKGRDGVVLIALTESSLHRRNITHYSATTLRSTISFNLLQVAEPKVGEIIIDPFCGSGSIPMESAIGFPGTYHICGDKSRKSVQLTNLNKSTYGSENSVNLLIDPLRWDVCALPLRNSCIDVIITDLPFGLRVGSKSSNKGLYMNGLRELARVVKPITGRAVLFTADRRAYSLCLQHNKKYWKQMKVLGVKQGGIKAFVYLLSRTDCDFP